MYDNWGSRGCAYPTLCGYLLPILVHAGTGVLESPVPPFGYPIGPKVTAVGLGGGVKEVSRTIVTLLATNPNAD